MIEDKMKAVILAAGNGKRLGLNIPKCLVEIGPDETLLSRLIKQIIEAGIPEEDICVVAGYKYDNVIKYLTHRKYKTHIIIQEERLGTAHALSKAESFAKYNDIIVACGDNYFDGSIKDMISLYKNSHTDGLISIFELEEPRDWGIVHLDNNYVHKMILYEPCGINSKFSDAEVYILPNRIYKYIMSKGTLNMKKGRHEWELVLSINKAIEDGMNIEYYKVAGHVNINEKKDLERLRYARRI